MSAFDPRIILPFWTCNTLSLSSTKAKSCESMLIRLALYVNLTIKQQSDLNMGQIFHLILLHDPVQPVSLRTYHGYSNRCFKKSFQSKFCHTQKLHACSRKNTAVWINMRTLYSQFHSRSIAEEEKIYSLSSCPGSQHDWSKVFILLWANVIYVFVLYWVYFGRKKYCMCVKMKIVSSHVCKQKLRVFNFYEDI